MHSHSRVPSKRKEVNKATVSQAVSGIDLEIDFAKQSVTRLHFTKKPGRQLRTGYSVLKEAARLLSGEISFVTFYICLHRTRQNGVPR